MFAAFIVPSASPVPTRLCTSSIKRMILPSALTSSIRPLILDSNCPLNCVPATSAVRSSKCISLFASLAGTSPAAILSASPSAIAVLPTPGSPIRQGLFFVLRQRICSVLAISLSLPIMLSSLPSLALSVRSVQ